MASTGAHASKLDDEIVPHPSEFNNVWQRRTMALEADFGVALPVGGAGLMFEYSPLPDLAFACGAGASNGGLQLACMLRPRIILRKNKALTLGFGGSTGPHRQGEKEIGLASVRDVDSGMAESPRDETEPPGYRWDRAYWFNLEFGFEMRLEEGFVFRPVIGLAYLTNFGSGEREEPAAGYDPTWDETFEPTSLLLYGGVGVGCAW